MRVDRDTLITALIAFAGGVVVGTILAPKSGSDLRRQVADNARLQAQKFNKQLQRLEEQLEQMEEQIMATSEEFGQKVRDATKNAVDHYVPSVTKESENWEIDSSELTKDLRRMPHE